MHRKAKITVALSVLVVVIALVSIFSVVQAQTTAGQQQWQYTILTWDFQNSEFSWNTSTLYDDLDFDTKRDVTQNVWDALAGIDGAGLVDYLAVMGLSNYELVDIVGPVGGVMLYTFKRPLQ